MTTAHKQKKLLFMSINRDAGGIPTIISVEDDTGQDLGVYLKRVLGDKWCDTPQEMNEYFKEQNRAGNLYSNRHAFCDGGGSTAYSVVRVVV